MSTQVKIDGNSIKVLVIKFTLRVLFFNNYFLSFAIALVRIFEKLSKIHFRKY